MYEIAIRTGGFAARENAGESIERYAAAEAPERALDLFLHRIHDVLSGLSRTGDVRDVPRHVCYDKLENRTRCGIETRGGLSVEISLRVLPDEAGDGAMRVPEGIPQRREPLEPGCASDIAQLDLEYSLRSFGDWIDAWLPVIRA